MKQKRRLAALLLATASLAACAARAPVRPSGIGLPDPAASTAFSRATTQCAGLSTLTAELRLSGRAHGERMRGTLHAGLAAPAAVRVEAVAPFGQPFFILAGTGDRATLLFPRESSVLRDAAVNELLARLAGLPFSATDLLHLLSGCPSAPDPPAGGRTFGSEWQAVTLRPDLTAFLRRRDGVPVLVAIDHGDWRIDYSLHLNSFPRRVRLRNTDGTVDITATLEQVEINTAIDARAFIVTVPADAVALTLEDVRSPALRRPQ